MKATQRGITLIETLGALAIVALLTLGLTSLIDGALDDMKGQQVALHQEQVAEAARKYIAANYLDLKTATAGGAVSTITVAQLQTAGFLPANYSTTNAFGQKPCVLVRQPAAGKLDALVATYGGQAIPERDIRLAAMHAGQGGGYISTTAPGTARGTTWELTTTDYRDVACDGTTVLTGAAANDGGHLVSALFYDGPGQLSTDFLYRDAVPGRPELNRMNTPIALGGAAVVTRGSACGSEAAIGIENATRQLLVCGTDGLWRETSNWRSPVATFDDLPATGNGIGDVRIVTDLNRAFTYNWGGWSALAVDENGNMLVPGTLNVTHVQAGGTIKATVDVFAGHVVYAPDVIGDMVRANYWFKSPAVYLSDAVSAGDPCHIIEADGFIAMALGTVKRDHNGILLTCIHDGVGYSFRYQDAGTTPPH